MSSARPGGSARRSTPSSSFSSDPPSTTTARAPVSASLASPRTSSSSTSPRNSSTSPKVNSSLTSSRRSKSPDTLSGETPGLRRLVQQRLLQDVFQRASDKDPGWKILVLDDHAMQVISAAVGMYDIMERKITLVESLGKKRAPFPDLGAIYLLEPSSNSVNQMLADFENKEGKKPLYGQNIFLYFLGRLPDSLIERIKTCKPLLKRLKALAEVNVDFLAKEERAFTFNMHLGSDSSNAFAALYLRKQNSPVEVLIADRLVTVCATLNEYPHIRYRQSSGIATSLANVFHLKMDEYVANNPNWWYHGGPQKNHIAQRDRGTLLLLDRADDCLTPLMHDFVYQCMVHDLLTLEGDRITYQSEKPSDPTQTEAKDVLLDERDKLWVELRGHHIAKVIQILSDRIREITQSSTGSALGNKNKNANEGNMSLSQMASALKALPEYREVMSKLAQHMHLSHECMDVFRKQNLLELSELEQTLATGKDDEGRTPKLNDVLDKVEDALMKMKDPKARLRLILIATISQGGLRQQDRRRLMNAADLSRKDTRTLNALEVLGLSTLSSNEKKSLVAMITSGLRSSNSNVTDDESEYASSRYAPQLKGILQDLANNELSFEDYPSVLPMPEAAAAAAMKGKGGSARASANRNSVSSARKSAGPSNRWSKSSGNDTSLTSSTGPLNLSGGRNLVFMMGGISYSEIRVCREVMTKTNREIICGSTAFISAEDFMRDLELLGRDED